MNKMDGLMLVEPPEVSELFDVEGSESEDFEADVVASLRSERSRCVGGALEALLAWIEAGDSCSGGVRNEILPNTQSINEL